ncbi:MAG: hypothetical protein Q7J35_00850 [Candidatus Methanoperedens sp.]|nr:hypothetical protein [Candidatus Methanoperedens sp.]
MQNRRRAYFRSISSERRWGATPDPGEAPQLVDFNLRSMVAGIARI